MEDKTMKITALMIGAALLSAPGADKPLVFDREKIGDVIYEAAAIFDVDNDGHKDIFCIGRWFPGPDFKECIRVCDPAPHDDYYDDFSCYPMDVNGDGLIDVISGGYWGGTLMWRENPGGRKDGWKTHNVAKTGNIERNVFYDLDGDGTPEVFPVTSPVHIFRLKKDAEGKGAGGFEQFTVKTDKGGGHGFGCGDVNGDGRPDLLFHNGWLEAPADVWDMDGWKWHDGPVLDQPSVPILVHDVNADGRNDLIVGCAHCYGLFWYEQKGAKDNPEWVKHDIETERSQFHDLQLHDIDNDGDIELITGKRYRAHNGHDPGGHDPLFTVYYEINGGNFERVTLDYGPPDQASGVGIYFWVDDIDGNGWKDIAAPGKEGLYLFRNRGPLNRTAAN
jgi:hypothetical protein